MKFELRQVDLDILRQSNQEIYIKLDLLNSSFKTIDSLEGEVINGSSSENSESDIRTSASVTFHIKDDSFLVGEDRKIWLDKYVRLSMGVFHLRSKEIIWYSMGVFTFNENSYSYNSTEKSLSVNLLDLMAELTGLRGGQTKGLSLTIPVDSSIRNSIISTLEESGKKYDYLIEDDSNKTPYDLQFGAEATVYQVVSELSELTPGKEIFFDETTFVYQSIPTCINDDVVLDARTIEPLVISESLYNSFSEVKNVTDLWGQNLDADRYGDAVGADAGRYKIILDNFFKLPYGIVIGFKANRTLTTPVQLRIENPQGDRWTYPIRSEDGKFTFEQGTSYVVRFVNDAFLYQGAFEIHYIVKEFSEEPSQAFKNQDYLDEGTKNIKYIINPTSPYAVDKIGEIRRILSDGEYQNIYSESLARQRAEYENWTTTRLVDGITLEMIMIPWLKINTKIEYKSKITGETHEYIVKNISRNLMNWTMRVEMIKFYPLYPFIVGNNIDGEEE